MLEAVYVLQSHLGEGSPSLSLPPLVRALATGTAVLQPVEKLLQVFSVRDQGSASNAELVLQTGVNATYDAAMTEVGYSFVYSIY